MRAAILNGSRVARVVMLNNLAEHPGAIDGTDADVGDTYAGGVFTKPAPSAEDVARAAIDMKQAADAAAAKADAKVAALGEMTPAQVRNWVNANVSNLADAKDVLGTLAVAVSILARRI